MELRPSIAGTWYPSDPDALRSLIHEFFELVPESSPATPETPKGLLVPHAGYVYSGGVASHAYASLKQATVDLVVVLGPFHAYHEAPFLVSQFGGYRTPFGPVPIEHDLVQRIHDALEDRSGMGLKLTADTVEHSIEIQLPLLQTVLGDFRLVPIMLAHQNPTAVAALAGALAECLQDGVSLFIASSDLSHFNPQHLAMLLDREMLRRIESLQPEAVLSAELEGAGSACGAGAIAAMLMAVRAFGASHAKVLAYRSSGDVTGSFDSVIGYAAAIFW